ncbi:ABC transporter permease, partial [Escherichia coli]
ARILLLFLGLPGVVLALLLTISVVRADSVRRRHDFALLSLRGAGAAQVVSLVAVGTMVVSLLAVSFGVAASIALSRLALHVDVGIYGTAAWLSVTAFAAIA